MQPALLLTLLASCLMLVPEPARAQPEEATYTVRQTASLGPLESGKKKKIRWWVSIPGDTPHQEVLDISVVSTPGSWEIVRESKHGNRFLYIEVDRTTETSLDAVVDFTLRRRAVATRIDLDRVGAITDANRKFFSDELVLDAPHMVVTPDIRKMADEACGDERNIARQAALLLDKVASVADHYSKDPTKPNCGVGDAGACVKQGGGCCTDLHSLFIAMARSRGIPSRLQMGYRMLARNEGKLVDPGYRCWVEYFVPGYGWVSADIVEADAPGGLGKGVWFTGMTVERLWLNQGRELILPNDPTPEPVNHMSIGYAEVAGKAVRLLPEGELPTQITRKVRFTTAAGDS